MSQGTRVVTVEPPGARKGSSGYLQRQLPANETRTALLGNYLLSEGKPGKVGAGRPTHTHLSFFFDLGWAVGPNIRDSFQPLFVN